MELYLVRHGDTQLGPDGLYPDPAPLSDLGREQAEALVPRLVEVGATVLVTSGVLRAVETAAPFAAASGLRAAEAPGFDEIGVGRLGLELPERRRARLTIRPMRADFSEFGGESSSDFVNRVLATLESAVLARYTAPGDRVVAVIHGGPIQVILDHAQGRAFDGVLRREIPPASVTSMRLVGGRFRVELVGDTAHLEGLSSGH